MTIAGQQNLSRPRERSAKRQFAPYCVHYHQPGRRKWVTGNAPAMEWGGGRKQRGHQESGGVGGLGAEYRVRGRVRASRAQEGRGQLTVDNEHANC